MSVSVFMGVLMEETQALVVRYFLVTLTLKYLKYKSVSKISLYFNIQLFMQHFALAADFVISQDIKYEVFNTESLISLNLIKKVPKSMQLYFRRPSFFSASLKKSYVL